MAVSLAFRFRLPWESLSVPVLWLAPVSAQATRTDPTEGKDLSYLRLQPVFALFRRHFSRQTEYTMVRKHTCPYNSTSPFAIEYGQDFRNHREGLPKDRLRQPRETEFLCCAGSERPR